MHKAIASNFYRGSYAAIIVFDKSSRRSFDEIGLYFSELRIQVYHDIPILLVGNKADTGADGDEFINYETGFRKACEIGALYVETSALTGFNVEFAFYNLASSAFLRNFCARK